ncbi:polysaccharide deacetylase family protein [Endomicrobium proavitum]|uniref:Putative Polysaccharide deacetylase n=1 Tax=Endomicrobium proavitum TaxID=1408281 RepID=A0A0G3WHP1_9BACT|nr:polysaccharide deacetylase family protein [Endomicrobium proavitum]AKL97425.1 putative Polysaccharide deacetylase [Endomicrobium proavitum]
MKKFIILVLLFLASVSFAQNRIFYAAGSSGKKKVALTFDDGPGAITKDVLEILKNKNVKATFFMLGINAAQFPATAKLIKEQGHEIANHTWAHVNFYAYKSAYVKTYYLPYFNKKNYFDFYPQRIREEISGNKKYKIEEELLSSQKAIQSATGVKPFLVRYPHGYAKPDAIEVARKNGYYVINWTFGCDWHQNMTAEEMHNGYKQAIRNGAIFLMHDGSKNRRILSFLDQFIDEIKEQGYEIVTISELLELKPKEQ